MFLPAADQFEGVMSSGGPPHLNRSFRRLPFLGFLLEGRYPPLDGGPDLQELVAIVQLLDGIKRRGKISSGGTTCRESSRVTR